MSFVDFCLALLKKGHITKINGVKIDKLRFSVGILGWMG